MLPMAKKGLVYKAILKWKHRGNPAHLPDDLWKEEKR
jgi:hypothetical protein